MLTTHLSLLNSWMAHAVPLAADAPGFNLLNTFMNAEWFGRIIVLLLMFFSLLAWTVMIGKYMDLSRWREQNLDFEERVRDTQGLMGQGVSASLRQNTPYARLFRAAIDAARQHSADRDPSVRMGLVENALQRGVGTECMNYETKMVLLGSLVAGAPFMGLLGTVVGVMVAFNGMATPGSTSTIQGIAPGVASALLATVAGLIVAIPSVFGYNFLLSQTKLMITELENYASWLADRLELEMEAQKTPPSPAPATYPATAPVVYAAPAPHPAAPAAPQPPAAPPPVAERYLRFDVSEED